MPKFDTHPHIAEISDYLSAFDLSSNVSASLKQKKSKFIFRDFFCFPSRASPSRSTVMPNLLTPAAPNVRPPVRFCLIPRCISHSQFKLPLRWIHSECTRRNGAALDHGCYRLRYTRIRPRPPCSEISCSLCYITTGYASPL